MLSGKRGPWASRLTAWLSLVIMLGLVTAGVADGSTRRDRPAVVAVGQLAPAPMNSVASVSCANRLRCWAVGQSSGSTAAIDATSNGGATWSHEAVPTTVTDLASLSCAGENDCLAVGASGGAGAVVAFGGRTWALHKDLAGAAALSAVDCTSAQHCVAVATDGTSSWSVLTTNEGVSWARAGNLPAGMSATAITCRDPSACFAAGFIATGPGKGVGAIAGSADGGATWAAVSLPAPIGILRDITCNGTSCLAAGTSSTATTGFVAAGGQLIASSNGGSTWQILPPSVPDNDASGIACPGPNVCVVVGTDWVGTAQPQPRAGIVASTDGGRQWQQASLKYVPVGLSSVACPVVTQCVAAGGNVLVRVSLPAEPPAPSSAPGT